MKLFFSNKAMFVTNKKLAKEDEAMSDNQNS